ncbi:MAG: TylF/MycF family methyltransferase [Polyangiales bacterium]
MEEQSARTMYLDLLRKTVTGQIIEDKPKYAFSQPRLSAWLRPSRFDRKRREEGKDVPTLAHTMIGARRMKNVQYCMEDVLRAGVPGDFIETGVWRGGATIFMRGVLKAYGVTDRRVWVADSFAGLPKPDAKRFPTDRWLRFDLMPYFAVSEREVRDNFEKYDLLDAQVCFLKGWFKDTLPQAPIASLAVMRLDGDLYESTMDALVHLYPKLSVGGYVIIDDYVMPSCAKAVHDYRAAHGITEPMVDIDGAGRYWKRTTAPGAAT